MTVDKIGQLWAWAEEYAGLVLPGDNPARQVAALPVEHESAPAWTPAPCTAFERQPHERMVTFYFLAHYTGQRKGDCCDASSAPTDVGKSVEKFQATRNDQAISMH